MFSFFLLPDFPVEKLHLVRNLDDDMVVPSESAHFGFFAENSESAVVNCTQTHLYRNDTIGLRQLIDENRVTFEALPGKHVAYDSSWLSKLAETFFCRGC